MYVSSTKPTAFARHFPVKGAQGIKACTGSPDPDFRPHKPKTLKAPANMCGYLRLVEIHDASAVGS